MKIIFLSTGWEDYLFWQSHYKKILKRINTLINECRRSPFTGIGKPEPLKENLTGWWSRRINQEHRLVYKVKDEKLYILQCRRHY